MKLDRIIIDGRYLLCWGDAIGTETTVQLPSGNVIFTSSVASFITTIIQLVQQFRPSAIQVAWEGVRNWRYDVFPEYKQDRRPRDKIDPERRPRLNSSEVVVKQVLSKLGIEQFYCLDGEADDVMYTLTRGGDDKVGIYTSDRDIFQCVGDSPRVWIVNKREGGWNVAGTAEVEAKFKLPPNLITDLFILAGSKDNYPGVKGIGLVKAASILQRTGSLAKAIRSAGSDDHILADRERELILESLETLRIGAKFIPLRVVELILINAVPDIDGVLAFLGELNITALKRPANKYILKRMARGE